MRQLRSLFLVLCLLLSPLPAVAGGGIVSSADPRASEAGRDILRQGGSATDAAMAMMLALTVVEPESSGIGGGGFFLHHDGRTGALDTVDGRETAPASASPGMFLNDEGKPLPFLGAAPGGKSVGVPGNVALMAKVHARWGKLPWAALFQPAIRLATEGYVVNDYMYKRMMAVSGLWKDFPDARALYWIDGKPAPIGSHIRNPALAAYLKTLAAEGPDAFYKGPNAEAIASAVGGAPINATRLTLADLAAYEAKDRPAICGRYRTWKICGMGPPSSGAITVIELLGMLQRFDLAKLGKDNPQSWHLIAEAMRLAYADRDKWLADRDFALVPVTGLIDPAYIARRATLIDARKARGDYPAGTPTAAPARTAAISSEVPSTTHFVAIDAAGDIATMTSTVEGYFGSQLIVNGYVLNNELTDFAFAPEKDGAPVANRPEPGKRPLSSMAPTIVYDADDKPVFVIGAAGGRTIIMQVAKAIIARLDWGMSSADAIALGLLYFNKDGLALEKDRGMDWLVAPLTAMGHHVEIQTMALKANGAARTPTGWVGAADPRSPGQALDAGE